MTRHSMIRPVRLILSALSLTASLCVADTSKSMAFPVEDFQVEGDNPLGSEETRQILSGFTHKSHTLSSLHDVAKTLETRLHQQGYTFYRVVLPPQTLENDAVIHLKITAFTVGDMTVEGNRYFDTANILASLPHLRMETPPDNEGLAQDIKLANQHPRKQLNVVFHPQDQGAKLGARVSVKDENPHEFMLMMNTRGTSQTGDFRMMGAYQYSNLWGMDHIVNVNYTFSPDHFDEVRQYGASYMLPLYRIRGWLSGYYARSDVDTGTVGGLFDISGSGEMGGVHYKQYLPRLHTYEHWLDLGWDDKLFNNNVIYGEVQNLGVNVRSRPLSITYRAQFTLEGIRAGWDVGWAGNTGGGDFNTREAYSGTRTGARPDWNVVRFGTFWDVGLPLDMTWRNTVSGQYSHDSLIPAEQIGLGGLTTVRGYHEREVGGDSGHIYKTELWSPELLPGFHILAFYDQAHRELQQAQAGQKSALWLRSTGMGARWHWQQHLSLSVDLAHAFDQTLQTQAGSGRVHAQLMYRF